MSNQTKIINDVAVSLKEIMMDIGELLPEIQTVNGSIVDANNRKSTIISSLETPIWSSDWGFFWFNITFFMLNDFYCF
ncbi:hypothetical protein [Clostridium sp.]|uniref:hypothetical protein n=1 Tax=Clostridium sp. TaxID=1506 RepID=UPI001A4E1E26|nr:hypothetical protein [Clostridium sp.]MBK5241831.1 hypothetical protein [Clostridium sp.]